MKYDTKIREEELKHKVVADWFAASKPRSKRMYSMLPNWSKLPNGIGQNCRTELVKTAE